MTPTIKADVRRESETSATIYLEVAGLPEGARLHVDDSTDGTFAGMDPQCASCSNRVGYVNCDVPSTMEEAYAAAFIPCVELVEGEALYCLPCVMTGEVPASEDDGDDGDED